jgi:hypothetical protein
MPHFYLTIRLITDTKQSHSCYSLQDLKNTKIRTNLYAVVYARQLSWTNPLKYRKKFGQNQMPV